MISNKETGLYCLEEFFKGIKEIQYKNHGGCLFMCYAFKRFLEDFDDLKTFQIVQYAAILPTIEHNMRWSPSLERIPLSSNHFTWMFYGKEYDGDGEFFGVPLLRRVLGIKLEHIDEFCKQALREPQWNAMFNRLSAVNILWANLKLDMEDCLGD